MAGYEASFVQRVPYRFAIVPRLCRWRLCPWRPSQSWHWRLQSPAAAQQSSNGDARARVVSPIRIVNTAPLDFGKIITNGTGIGRVRINARTGARQMNRNVTPYGVTGFQRASFAVTGEARTMINLTTSSPVVTLNGPGAPMTMDQLRINRDNGGQRALPVAFRLPRNGEMTVGFGGRLRVANNQAPGVYTGSFDLIVAYQ